MFPTCKNSQKWVKTQKSTDKHSPFDGLIQEVIDLSDIYLAVVCTYFEEKKTFHQMISLLQRVGDQKVPTKTRTNLNKTYSAFSVIIRQTEVVASSDFTTDLSLPRGWQAALASGSVRAAR